MTERPSTTSRWAGAADLLSLALLGLAAWVAVTGGFKGRPWGIAVSVTSPERIVAWAVAVLVVRHLARPRPSAFARLLRGARAHPMIGLALVASVAGLAGLAAVRGLAKNDDARQLLFSELQPSWLRSCTFERFGEKHDGGYLLCANLLGSAGAGYSYGINGYDGWGCDVSRRLHVPVHQYDCFNTSVPVCTGGTTRFHDECIADRPSVDDEGRRFDTLWSQVARNGDQGTPLVLKIDVEGAEWASLLAAPDATFERIDQIAAEFHGVDDPRSIAVVRRLKRFFYVAHLHFNNYSCAPGLEPFPASAYQALLVSKRLGRLDRVRSGLTTIGVLSPPSSPLAVPDDPRRPDCQQAGAPPV